MVAIGLTESTVTVLESVRSVVVCVRISKRIARALAFRVTTRNGTAKGELYDCVVDIELMHVQAACRFCTCVGAIAEHTYIHIKYMSTACGLVVLRVSGVCLLSI